MLEFIIKNSFSIYRIAVYIGFLLIVCSLYFAVKRNKNKSVEVVCENSSLQNEESRNDSKFKINKPAILGSLGVTALVIGVIFLIIGIIAVGFGLYVLYFFFDMIQSLG